MAKKHVINYFLNCQQQYAEMVDNINDLKQALKTKYIDQERYNEALKEINVVKDNYDRLAYIVMLLNLPNKNTKAKKLKKQDKDIYDYLATANEESILAENEDAIKQLRSLAKKYKEDK